MPAARRIAQWKMDQAEKRLTVEGWTLPDLSTEWQELVEKHLGEERGAQAIAIRAKQRAEVKQEMESFLERWASTGRVPMDEELRLLIESLLGKLKLESGTSLFTAAKKLVDEHAATELAAGMDLLSSLPEEQRLVAMGQGNSFATRFVRPKGTDLEKKWAETITSFVGAESVKQWQKLVAEQKAKEEVIRRFAQAERGAGTNADGGANRSRGGQLCERPESHDGTRAGGEGHAFATPRFDRARLAASGSHGDGRHSREGPRARRRHRIAGGIHALLARRLPAVDAHPDRDWRGR